MVKKRRIKGQKDWKNMSEAQLMRYIEVRGNRSVVIGRQSMRQSIEVSFPSEWAEGFRFHLEIQEHEIDGHKYDIDIKRVS